MTRSIGSDVGTGARRRHVGAVRHWTLFVAIVALLVTLPGAVSAAAGPGTPYAGAGIGGGATTVDKATVQFHTLDWEPSIAAWRVFAGYGNVGGHFGIEGGYVALGKSRVTTSGGDYFETRLKGYELTPTASIAIAGHLSALARAGVVFWSSEIGYQYTSLATGTSDESGSGLALALGLEYAVVPHVLVRLEAAFDSIDKAKAGAGDARFALIGARYAF